MTTIVLPPKQPGMQVEHWPDAESLVAFGANGSGKSQFGAWIEQNNDRQVHRVSAQRSLQFSDLVTPMPFERARYTLQYGNYQPSWDEPTYRQQRLQQRWGGRPTLQMLTDYDVLLSTLFAAEAKRNREYTINAFERVPSAKPADSSLDLLRKIWSRIFPQRELVVHQDKITARIPGLAQEYAGSSMSDGERVALYLIGQVLSAPSDAIIVIDEPEIHLHRAIQASLWDQAESSRPDCMFVYITHDLEFAATRSAARKIWVDSYDGSSWKWQEITSESEIPDELLFQVLGSRRPVLLVEGDANSYDAALYRALYPDQLVVPVSSCNRVVSAKRALQELNYIHYLEIKGLVDRDHRSDAEIAALRSQGILVVNVAEVENLFCMSTVLRVVATQLQCGNGAV